MIIRGSRQELEQQAASLVAKGINRRLAGHSLATFAVVGGRSVGAVLDGAIFGDHCSPLSDTTIMSSIAASCDHLDHVRTQIPYSLTVAAGAVAFGYLLSMVLSPAISYVIAVAAFAGFLYFFGKKAPEPKVPDG